MGRIRHIVQPGEHLTRICIQYGLPSQVVWLDPDNQEVRLRRQNPHVLLPGDSLYVRGQEVKEAACATEHKHRFRLTVPALYLRLALMDASGQPLANLRCVLQVEGDNRSVTTDAAGRIVQRIPFAAEKALLIAGTKELEMRIGHLDPEAEVSGWYARLSNLGYPVGESDEPDDERLRFAIEEFQCDQGMQVTGVCDAATQAKLKELHGC